MLQAGRPQVRLPMRSLNFFTIFLIRAAALDLEVYSASNRNEYQKKKNKCFNGVERGRCLRLTTSAISVSRFSVKYGIDIYNSIGLHCLLRE
jgi:hypothetical protein